MTASIDRLVAKCDQSVWQRTQDSINFNDNPAGYVLKNLKYQDLPTATLSVRQRQMRGALNSLVPVLLEELTTRALQFSDDPELQSLDPLTFFEKLVESFRLELEHS